MNRDQLWMLTLTALLLVCFWAGMQYMNSRNNLSSELRRRQQIVEAASQVKIARTETSQFAITETPDQIASDLAIATRISFRAPVPSDPSSDLSIQPAKNYDQFQLYIPEYEGTLVDCNKLVNRIIGQSPKLRIASLTIQSKHAAQNRKPGDIEVWSLSGKLKFIAKLPK